MTSRLREIWDELQTIERDISQWCMRMAWPGGVPTPPFAAWEKRSKLYDELRDRFAITHPKYFHKRPRP